ncbi:tRNA pseudouridine synthase A [Indibacter alkaliphilus LW1]|uniref:tRNA pseudouridine synthase A n=1 Tax=Indibacter alkaliphilus (strain CCUG 57479 / KCTC 22604 / LW1) TaxID=1189612 RepID=S2E9Z5_INDAL|nr:tRNA pseudouridine(38-40) synthase TruA [Indibacter alkaliphilus]EOZ99128.1 tRNA pseudouridine synthase A [Indibacter alkaliphilus LW1]
METKRYFLELAYKGSGYHGWQIQKNANSVQEEIEKALSVLLGKNTPIVGSGRTDTGVHASQTFAHFDSDIELEKELFTKKLNGILGKSIAIYDLIQVKNEAHARFDAVEREYLYRCIKRKNPFESESSWQIYSNPDIDLMNQAAKLLLEYDDFECFSKVKTEVNNFRCEIKEAIWEQNAHELLFHITANRFLRGMVRAIVGTLMEVGLGKITVEDFRTIIESKNRKEAKSSAPAQGLYLCRVTYPEKIFI